jgi:DNA processing protein
MSDLKYWIAFDKVRQLGTVRFRLLEGFFGSLEDAWNAPIRHIRTAGLDRRTVGFVEEGRKTIDPDRELERLDKAGVSAFNWNDSGYPALLKQIPDPPPVLYVKGKIEPEDQRSIALVGTRKATPYGKEAAQVLAADLSRSGISVVSGLARGIDTVAHKAALSVGGRTLAVMASGVDYIYPRENKQLAREIAETGALISEHPLGVRPDARQFPRRNRLMSGMTLGTLVVEAGRGSGAIWTVRHALEQDREVFCIPGSIFSPASSGPNQLIQEGAKLVMNYQDILQEMNLNTIYNLPLQAKPARRKREAPPAKAATNQIPLKPAAPELVGDEKTLFDQISYEPIHIDQICRGAGLPVHVVSSTLTIMELNGLVKQVPGMQYVLAREASNVYG